MTPREFEAALSAGEAFLPQAMRRCELDQLMQLFPDEN
jgi:uncharacterized phage protein (TIGR02216 family)